MRTTNLHLIVHRQVGVDLVKPHLGHGALLRAGLRPPGEARQAQLATFVQQRAEVVLDHTGFFEYPFLHKILCGGKEDA